MQTRRSLGSKPQGSGAMPRRGMAHNSPNPHNRQSLNTARQKAISCCADSAHEVIYSIDYNHKSFQPITGQTQRQSSNDRFASVFRPWCNLQHQLLWALSSRSLRAAPRSALGRKLTCQPVQLWEQAKKCHSDLMHKSGPLSGPLIYFKFGINVCN